MTQRKWLAEGHAWLDDPTSVEFEDGVGGIWQTARRLDPINRPDLTWRIKPATITINGTELPKPIAAVSTCWRLGIKGPDEDRSETFWFNTREDRDAVYAKLVEVLGS